MALENKLGLTDEAALARAEEKISKTKALELYDTGLLDTFPVGRFEGLAKIHAYLFGEVYPFAGQLRTVNIAKGSFRFAPVMYLRAALDSIDAMPQSTFEEIIEKYVEMNVPILSGRAMAAAPASGWTASSKKSCIRSLTGAGWTRATTCLPWSAAPSRTWRSRPCCVPH